MTKKRTNQQPKPSRIFGNDVQQRNVWQFPCTNLLPWISNCFINVVICISYGICTNVSRLMKLMILLYVSWKKSYQKITLKFFFLFSNVVFIPRQQRVFDKTIFYFYLFIYLYYVQFFLMCCCIPWKVRVIYCFFPECVFFFYF